MPDKDEHSKNFDEVFAKVAAGIKSGQYLPPKVIIYPEPEYPDYYSFPTPGRPLRKG